MKNFIVIIIAALALSFAGCTTPEHNSGNVGSADITGYTAFGLYSPDAAFKLVEEKGIQLCVNPARKNVRLQNGDQTIYVNVKLSSAPQEGGKVNVTLTSAGTFIPSGEYEMETVKADGERIWLRSDKFNLIIPAL